MEMEYDSMTDISNIYAKYRPAIYKDFHINKKMLNLITNRKKKILFYHQSNTKKFTKF